MIDLKIERKTKKVHLRSEIQNTKGTLFVPISAHFSLTYRDKLASGRMQTFTMPLDSKLLRKTQTKPKGGWWWWSWEEVVDSDCRRWLVL